MCFAFWSQNEQPNTVYLCSKWLLLKRFMTLLQTLTSNLSDLHSMKPPVFLPLQKYVISVTYSMKSFQNQPDSVNESKTTAGPHRWFDSMFYPLSPLLKHTGPPIPQHVHRCKPSSCVSHWARTDSKPIQNSQKLCLYATNIIRANSS